MVRCHADSGFYDSRFIAACRRAGAAFSVTARIDAAVARAIAVIPETAWVPIPYWDAVSPLGATDGAVDNMRDVCGGCRVCNPFAVLDLAAGAGGAGEGGHCKDAVDIGERAAHALGIVDVGAYNLDAAVRESASCRSLRVAHQCPHPSVLRPQRPHCRAALLTRCTDDREHPALPVPTDEFGHVRTPSTVTTTLSE